jgi:hypothetical protein
MIKEQTVLVLGAGASKDLGFPLGKRLWQDIYSFVCGQSKGSSKGSARGDSMRIDLDNSKLLARLLELAVGLGLAKEQDETNERFVKEFADQLFGAQPESIDQFLKDRPEYSLIGRICIVFCISRYEDKNSEYFIPTIPESSLDYVFPDFGWYEYLWHKMTENVDSIEEFKKNRITVITFNYDRSLEFYLFRALKSKFDKHDAEIADVFKEIEIKHVYGKLAFFYWELNYLCQDSDLSAKDYMMKANDFSPWEPSVLFRIWGEVGTHGMDERDFDSNRTVLKEEARREIVDRFIDAANDIKIYSEVLKEHKSGEYLTDLNNAKRIYFLGFGYHEQNLMALGMTSTDTDRVLNEGAKIFGTAYGMSDGEMSAKRRRIYRSKSSGKSLDFNITLSNNWGDMNSEDSIIKDFFRKVPKADLV